MQSDAELIAEYCASRSETAFAEIVSRHGQLVYRTCQRITGNAHEAEDVAQATFMVLAQKPAIVDRSRLSQWLYGVATRTSWQLVRERTRRARREQEAIKRMPADEVLPSAEKQEQVLAELDRALMKLPVSLREAVVLCYLEGRSQAEAAKLANCPIGTIGWRVRKGFDKLREILRGRGTVLGTTALAALLSAEASAAVPVKAMTALSLASINGHGAHAAALAKQAIEGLFWSKVKTVAASVALIATLGIAAPLVVRAMTRSNPSTPASPFAKGGTILSGHASPVTQALISADSTLIATQSDDCQIRVFDAATGNCRSVLAIGESPCPAAFSPDGTTLLVGINYSMTLWNLTSAKSRGQHNCHASLLSAVAFAPDGKSFVTADHGGTVKIWNAATEQVTFSAPAHEGSIRTVLYTPDSRSFITLGEHPLAVVHDAATGRVLSRVEGKTGRSGAISADGHLLATGDVSGNLEIWSLPDGRKVDGWKAAPEMLVRVSFDGDDRICSTGYDGVMKRWTLRTHALVSETPMNGALTISPDRTHAVIVNGDSTARFVKLNTNSP